MSRAIDTVEETIEPSSGLEENTSEDLRVHSFKIRHSEAKRKPVPRWALGSIGVGLLAVGAVSLWLHARHFETTDDAQIDGHINVVSSRISGTVLRQSSSGKQSIC